LLIASNREISKYQKQKEKELKIAERTEAEYNKELVQKFKVVKIRLQVDNDYDWVGSHVF